MGQKNILKIVYLLLCVLFFGANANAQTQDILTFQLKIDDKEYTVTKDIDPIFLGTYSNGTGDEQKQYPIVIDDNSNFEWGAAVAEGELAIIDIMEYASGKMISYIAYTIYYHNTSTGESGEFMLYELNGKKYLGQAEKIESVAENR